MLCSVVTFCGRRFRLSLISLQLLNRINFALCWIIPLAGFDGLRLKNGIEFRQGDGLTVQKSLFWTLNEKYKSLLKRAAARTEIFRLKWRVFPIEISSFA